jgi:hypothetical protein
MCGRDEEPRPNVTTHWKIIMACAHAGLWTRVVDSKKQASKGLKKIVDDAQ